MSEEKYRQPYEELIKLIEHGIRESKSEHLKFERRGDRLFFVMHTDEPEPAFSSIMLESDKIVLHILGQGSKSERPPFDCPALAQKILRGLGVSDLRGEGHERSRRKNVVLRGTA